MEIATNGVYSLGGPRAVAAAYDGRDRARSTPKISLASEGAIWYFTRRFAGKGCTTMCMLDEIRAKRDEIYAIARRHKAEKLWVFGSCARKEVSA